MKKETIEMANFKKPSLKESISKLIEDFLEEYVDKSGLYFSGTKYSISMLKKLHEIYLFHEIDEFVKKQYMERFFPVLSSSFLDPKNYNPKDLIKMFSTMIYRLVYHNQFETLRFFLNEKDLHQYFVDFNFESEAEAADGPKLVTPDLFNLAISQNALNTVHLLRQKLTWEIKPEHLNLALEYHAEEVFKYLLDICNLTSEQRLHLASRARSMGNVTILNYLNCSTAFYFEEVIKMSELKEGGQQALEKYLFNHISRAYRVTLEIKEVDNLCDEFLSSIKNTQDAGLKEIIENSVKLARKEYHVWGSMLAPYRTPRQLANLRRAYPGDDGYMGENSFEGEGIEKEIKYGYEKNEMAKDLIDLENNYDNKFVSFEDILLYFNKKNEALQKISTGDPFWELSKSGRMLDTPIRNRYDNIFPYLKAIYKMKSLSDVEHYPNGYILKQDNESIGEIMFTKLCSPGVALCVHGSSEHKILKPKIIKLHEEICLMEYKQIEANPDLFYTKIGKMLSLAGKLTPFRRGTGTFVETCLAYFHLRLRQGLQCPILKKLQLDVINICIPASIQEKIFLYFFKLESLPDFAQRYLNKLSNDPEIDYYLNIFKLGKYEVQSLVSFEIEEKSSLTDEEIAHKLLQEESIKYLIRNRNNSEEAVIQAKKILSSKPSSAILSNSPYKLIGEFKNNNGSVKNVEQNISQSETGPR